MGRFSNISVARYRRLLSAMGLKLNRTHGGHEMWIKEGMLRNAVFQTHEEPVPKQHQIEFLLAPRRVISIFLQR